MLNLRSGIIGAVTLTILVLSACESDPKLAEPSTREFENPYAYVGKQHNEGLAYAFSQLQGAAEDGLDRAEADRVIATSVRKYARNAAIPGRVADAIQLGFEIAQDPHARIPGIQPNASLTNGDSLFAGRNLSDEARRQVQRVLHFTEGDLSIEALRDSLMAVNITATQRLDSLEARIVLAGSAVALHSVKYWRLYGDEWIALLEDSNTTISTQISRSDGAALYSSTDDPEDIDWGEVGAMDVGGAVGGAIMSLGTGCAEVTAGVCALGMAALGSVASSAANAVTQFFSSIF